MSNLENDKLMERAMEAMDKIPSHPSGYDDLLWTAIKNSDLEEVKRLTHIIEAELAQSHFFNNDLMGA